MRAILDGTLQPGERLRDDELTAWLGTSRAPIREALGHLAEVGLVEMSPNRYTRVATVTPRLYAESGAVWAALVTRALHWGILDFPPTSLPRLEALSAEVRASDPAGYPPGPTVMDRFLAAIIAHCRNAVLLETIRIHDPLLQLGVNSFKRFLPREAIADYFDELVARCRAHDIEGLEASTRVFLAGPMHSFVETMTGHYAVRVPGRGTSDAGAQP
jgi:DNA-binding GntR family transcriptional regulator